LEQNKKYLEEYKTKNKSLEDDILKLNIHNQELEKDLFDSKQKIESLRLDKDELDTELNNIKIEFINNKTNLQDKIDSLQLKQIEDENKATLSNPESDEILNYNKFMVFLKDDLKEFSSLVRLKTKNLSISLRTTQDLIEKSEEVISNMVNHKQMIITTLLKSFKSALVKDVDIINDIFIKQNDNVNTNGRLECLKKQLAELIPYKLRYIQLEAKVEKLENDLVITNKKIDHLKELESLKDCILKDKEVKMNKDSMYITNIEAKLSDLKDFVFKNCLESEKLEEFSSLLKA